MPAILDCIAKTFRGKFKPASPDDFFALRLAHHLGEPQTAAHYALLLGRYSRDKLLAVYRKTRQSARRGESLGAIFHYELENGGTASCELPTVKLAAFRLERRSIAAAVFSGLRLKSVRLRNLPSNRAKAESSAGAFVGSILADFQPDCAAVEALPSGEGQRRAALQRAVAGHLAAGSVSALEFSLTELLAAFGYPALLNRRELREVAQSICPLPVLKPHQACGLDAVGLGLYVQTERLFNN